MQIRGKTVLVYQESQTDGRKLQLFRSANMREQQKKVYSGRLTAGAKKRLTKAITLMVQGTRRRWISNPVTKKQSLHHLTFVTLTVSDSTKKLDGKTAYKQLLSGFLQWLRKTKGVNTYIWKAELQKNGQIHYHVTCPDWIHYREIRNKWNDLQKKAGLLDAYFEKKGHYDANSTDVHKVYRIKDVAGYLVKEIAKSCQNEKTLGGKVWDCTCNLSKAKYFDAYMKEETYLFMETAVNENLCTKYSAERFTIYRFNCTEERIEEHLLPKDQLHNYQVWLRVLRDSITFIDP
jgi:ribosomal protein L28